MLVIFFCPLVILLFTVSLVCISLVINDVEHLSWYQLVIRYISSLDKHLFKSLVHLKNVILFIIEL